MQTHEKAKTYLLLSYALDIVITIVGGVCAARFRHVEGDVGGYFLVVSCLGIGSLACRFFGSGLLFQETILTEIQQQTPPTQENKEVKEPEEPPLPPHTINRLARYFQKNEE